MTPTAYRDSWASHGGARVPGCWPFSEAREFSVEHLGFEPGADVTMSEGFRWVSIKHPSQPEIEATHMTPGPPLTDEAAASRSPHSGRMLAPVTRVTSKTPSTRRTADSTWSR
jgi:hypothetical protein